MPDISVIIAVHNEADAIDAVLAETLAALQTAAPFELLLVDDGSTDDTAARIDVATARHPELRLLRLTPRVGKTAALRAGIEAARAPAILTMDGDGQNDPADLLALLHALQASPPPGAIVAGIRRRRLDTWSRRVATRVANGLRQRLLNDGCPDTGCGLKAFPRDAFLRLPAFEGMHRFLPALFQLYGHPLVCVPVAHRPRLAGTSKYSNLGRALVGIADLAGVLWLRARTHRPASVRASGGQEGSALLDLPLGCATPDRHP